MLKDSSVAPAPPIRQELREEAHGSRALAPAEVNGILCGAEGSLERYSRAVRGQQHIHALHHIEVVHRSQVTLSPDRPRSKPATTPRARQGQSRATCVAVGGSGCGAMQMIVNLLLLRGNIGKPGAGVLPVRGHSNVQGRNVAVRCFTRGDTYVFCVQLWVLACDTYGRDPLRHQGG